MALDIAEIRLNKRQEKEILKVARVKGRISLIEADGKVGLYTDDPEGDDVVVLDFGNHYYEKLLSMLSGKGILPSKELMKAIDQVLSEEKAYEDGAFFNAVGKIDGATGRAKAALRKEIERLLRADLAPKQRNDYRAVLRKLEDRGCKADYVEKWTGRILGAEKLGALEGRLEAARDSFGDAALEHRLYGRLFIKGTSFRGGERLQWARLLPPE